MTRTPRSRWPLWVGLSLIAIAQPAGAGGRPARPWGGPLAPVIGRLAWVEGHEATAAELAGRPVVVEFWTFACVNCRRTLPAMRALDRHARARGARVISIHSPELAQERDPAHVAAAVRREGIGYPVALDPGFLAWDAFGNRYWPCLYLLDGAGNVRFTHVGELHEGTPAWRDLIARIDALAAAR